jgi:hypothetical protein
MKIPSTKNLFRLFGIFLIVALFALPLSGMARYESLYILELTGTVYSGIVGVGGCWLFHALSIVFFIIGTVSLILSQLSLGMAIFQWLQHITGLDYE